LQFRQIANPSHCGASGPILLARARKGRRPQRPGNQHALTHVSGKSPGEFTLENRRLPLALPQIIRQAQESLTFSLNTLWDRLFRPATTKIQPLVKKLWTITLPCGKRRKTKEERPQRQASDIKKSQNL
jgi:hypothetical protein